MARDYWTDSIRRFDTPEDDDDEYSPPVVRDGGRALTGERAELELQRQREVAEAEERRREEEREQARLRALVDSGEVVFVDVDAHRGEKQRIQQMKHQTGNESGRGV